MEVCQKKISYNELLLQLLNKQENPQLNLFKSDLELDIYMTLLSQSNCKYPRKKVAKEHEILEKFLRKLNNLKVKIQLKRKVEEIDKLLKEIIEIYESNSKIISRYNKELIEIEKTIREKDAKSITKLIDKLTKEKMEQEYKEEKYSIIRDTIFKNFNNISHQIENNILYLNDDKNNIHLELSLEEFKEIFYYLEDIDSYDQIYQKSNTNDLRTVLINNLISALTQEKIPETIIPVILTHLCTKEIFDQVEINTSDFIIENIKITELYSLASIEDNQKLTNTAKWKNIMIPNDYLFSKLKMMIKNGMYYFKEDKFILENTTNDFKTSISTNKIIELLKEVLKK